MIGIAFRTENADKIKKIWKVLHVSAETLYRHLHKVSSIHHYRKNFNKEHPDTSIKLTPADQFELSDAYQWVL